ncbi:MAG: imidazole glycerol phosphate synthase subunit HisH [Selenomonadales bacterium]|nr:imidazole glycerol phosphate synthase subunit HisH [Selenomonadales bacterium]
MIAIIDYGMGNLRSVEKALHAVGTEAVITSDAEVIRSADKVILPGVGAFGDCMKNLEARGLVPVIHEAVASGKPFLSICLGLQLLFESSEESPGAKGLGIFEGEVKAIPPCGLKVPHMGWNSLTYQTPSPLYEEIAENEYVYFVHSFHAVPKDASIVTAQTEYGTMLTASVGKGNVQGAQFHPEKSSRIGLQMLKNFVNWNE